jgi:hypothetical protein
MNFAPIYKKIRLPIREASRLWAETKSGKAIGDTRACRLEYVNKEKFLVVRNKHF